MPQIYNFIQSFGADVRARFLDDSRRVIERKKVSYWKPFATIRQIIFFPTGNFSLLSVKLFRLHLT